MARKNAKKMGTELVLVDVLYEDGSRTSNRRIPAAEIEGLDAEERMRAFIEGQDQEIAEKSGRPRPEISSITRKRSK